MPKSITVRDVPDDVRNALAARAALRGRSLQAYLREELIAAAQREEVLDILRATHDRQRFGREQIATHEIVHAVTEDRR
ncbi:MAG: hypothetical protein WD336_11550 [Trueperaceae bacterium]